MTSTKVSVFAIFLFLLSPLFADLLFFPENPAIFSNRDYLAIELPITDIELMATNDVFTTKEIKRIYNMFQTDYVLTQDDKDLLIQNDLNIQTYNRASALEFGKRNWNFASNIYAFGNLFNLDKDYLDIVLNGIGVGDTSLVQKPLLDDIVSNLGNESIGMVFLKSIFTYSKLDPIYLYDIFDFTNVDATFYPGFNLNIYNPAVFAEVSGSSHRIEQDSTLGGVESYEYNISYRSSASEYTIYGNGFGFGLGFRMEIERGWLYFSVDDIFNSMIFKEVKLTSTKKKIQIDSKDIASDTTITIRKSDHTYNLKTTYVMGLEYYFFNDLSLMFKYKDSEYMLDNGLSLGLNYTLWEKIPFQIFGGQGTTQSYYTFRTGFLSQKFETTASFTFYDGVFAKAKGVGVGVDLFTIKIY